MVRCLWTIFFLITLTSNTNAYDEPLLLIKRINSYQDQASWIVNYRLYKTPKNIYVKSEGFLSNSSIPQHSTQKNVIHELSIVEKPKSEFIISEDCTHVLDITQDKDVLQLRFHHIHDVYGNCENLFGEQSIQIKLDNYIYSDRIYIEDTYKVFPEIKLKEPEGDKLDNKHYVSSPDSIHLDAAPNSFLNNQRFDDLPVRYGSKVYISFYYMMSWDTPDDFKMRSMQYRDSPKTTHVLSEKSVDKTMKSSYGKWSKHEEIIQIDNRANILCIDFRISLESKMGDVWIDDLIIKPYDMGVIDFPGGP